MGSFWEKNIVNNHFLIALVVVLGALLLWRIRSVVLSLFVAYIIVAALLPIVGWLVGRHVKRTLAVLLVYFAMLAAVLLLVAPLVPFLAMQLEELISRFPVLLTKAGAALGYSFGTAELAELLQGEASLIGRNTLVITKTIFSGFFSVVAIAVLSLYFLLDKERIDEGVAAFFENGRKKVALDAIKQMDYRLGSWVRGQLTLSLAVGLLTYVGLSVLGLPYALPLSIVAGILEMVPIIGPIVSAVPAVIVALNLSPVLGLTTVGLYVVVQLLENNLLVPKIMQQAVGLNPAAVILGIMVGGALLGIVGSLLAVPTVLVLKTISEAFRK